MSISRTHVPLTCQRVRSFQSKTNARQICRPEQARGQRHLTVEDIITAAPESKRDLHESRGRTSRNPDERRNVTRADKGKTRFSASLKYMTIKCLDTFVRRFIDTLTSCD